MQDSGAKLENDNSGRIFFDISGTIDFIRKHDGLTGIQRTSLNILFEVSSLSDCRNVFVSFFSRADNSFCCLPITKLGAEAFSSSEKLRQGFGVKPRTTKMSFLRRYWKKPVSYYFHLARLDLAYLFQQHGSFKRYGATRESWASERFTSVKRKLPAFQAESIFKVGRPGDKFVLLDAVWSDAHNAAVLRLHGAGFEVHSIVYDLIPVLHPAVTQENTSLIFHNWLVSAEKYVDQFIAISSACRDDMVRYAVDQRVLDRISVLPLAQATLTRPIGSDLSGSLSSQISPFRFPDLHEALGIGAFVRSMAAMPYVLCVGTLEGRKNGWRLVAAWKMLLSRGYANLPRLVFAGRWGWNSKELRDLLEGTGNLFGYVSVIETPSDRELTFLYRHCLFLAMPSLYEGWGLPVGEALAHGKTAVVSKVSSLSEVGGDLVEYCDPLSIESIADAVMLLTRDASRRQELEDLISRASLRSWADVARDLMNLVNR